MIARNIAGSINAATGWSDNSGQHSEEGSLSGTISTEEAYALTRCDGKIHVSNCGHRFIMAFE
ncbi:hypothetical protein AIF0345_0403 [Actinomyces israelii]|nr:hypothetical protein AIF0345_0403 [Actinomyces israelii]